MSLFDRPFLRLAVVGALAALALSACGRKGPLDPPPGAALVDHPQAAPGEPQPAPSQSNVIGGTSTGNRLAAPKGPNKHIPLDDILN
jgi:predicted small lipoprotein YifL